MHLGTAKFSWAVVALSLVAVSGFAFLAVSDTGRTLNIRDSADTYVSSNAPTTVFGLQTAFWAYKSANGQSFGLVSFDVSSQVAKSDIIVSARIKLIVNGSAGSFPAVMQTGRLLAGFSESTTTYNNAPAWTFDSVTNYTFDKRPGPGKTVILDVTQQLMTWRSVGQLGDFGLVLGMDPATANAGVAFASHESTIYPGPALQIFTQPPGQYGYGFIPSPGGLLALRTDL